MMTPDQIDAFLLKRIPRGWFEGPPRIEFDEEEILVVGDLPPSPRDDATTRQITDFREQTREERIRIATEAESAFGRKVSWGVSAGAATTIFTSLNVPVMTRLRLRERALLDTLVEGGVARSRSDALGWCVRLVASHEADWVADLRDALVGVQKARAEGPTLI